jgi:hypothetical protein
VRGGTLGALEYEHDVVLDPSRNSYITFRVTLENGSVLTYGDYVFDRDKNPNIISVVQTGTVLTITADSDTRSLRVQNSGGAWVYTTDGAFAVVDVSLADADGTAGLGASASDTYTITAYAEPVADVGVATLKEQRTVLISGGSAPAPSATITTARATAPAVSSASVTITVQVSSAPAGWTMKVYLAESATTTNVGTLVDHTAGLTPSVSPLPTTATNYAYTSDFTRVNPGTHTSLVTFKGRVDLLNGSGVVQDTKSFQTSWYTPN